MVIFPSIKARLSPVSRFSTAATVSSFILQFLFLFFHPAVVAQTVQSGRQPDSSRSVIVHSIIIDGNKHTRSNIIMREIPFHEQDTIPQKDFKEQLQHAKENIFNTALFNIVSMDTSASETGKGQYDIRIHVIERWYIWPWPYFEISDRNINTWFETTDLGRLTYGIDLRITDVRGRNETLRFPIHYGFNQKLGFNYTIPYVNRQKTIGLGFGAEYVRNHEVIVETKKNKTVYYKDPDQFPRQNLYLFTEILVRQSFYTRHTIRISYNSWIFNDSLLKIPGYLPVNDNHLEYFSLYYQYKDDHRDRQFYPLKGSYFDCELVQNGLWSAPVNEIFMKSNLRKYVQIFHRWYFASGLTMKLTLTPQPSYMFQRGLGYGREVVRGYEYYVIDGKDFTLWKNNFKFAILPERIFSIDFLRSRKFNTVPYALYLNVFCDAGYVSNSNTHNQEVNNLSNRLLVGYGMGIDFTTYYDVVIRLEASMNGKGEPGLYLHFIAPI